MLLMKNPQFLPESAETLAILPIYEIVIFTKFQINWTKIVDFSFIAYFCASAIFYYSVSIFSEIWRSQKTSRNGSRPQCNDKIRGVNLGGWLVLEPWITPKIFEEVNVGRIKGAVVDEYTYNQHVDKEFANKRLDK